MNSIMSNYFPIFQVYLKLRDDLMEMLVDEDLSFPAYGEESAFGGALPGDRRGRARLYSIFQDIQTRFLISGDRGKTRTIFFTVLAVNFIYF